MIFFHLLDNSDCETLDCSQLCDNITGPGSLTCACRPGYFLNILNLRECEGDLKSIDKIYSHNIIMLWQMLMSVNLILVTSMPIVRTSMEATNASAEVATVAMDGYAMVVIYTVQYPIMILYL
jgi:hypothetical protein